MNAFSMKDIIVTNSFLILAGVTNVEPDTLLNLL